MLEVRNTAELRRVRDLPRRVAALAPAVVDELTAALRTPTGTGRLRPVQALALHDIAVHGGAFCPIGVGEGKTLITLLAPYVLDAARPLLLLPANLVQKTARDREAYAKHWLVPKHTRLMSYESLGLVQHATDLDTYAPDLIIGDEIHNLKNRRAARTRRVARYMHAHPDTRFVALSGTIMSKSLTEFGHILRWCLKDGAPIPATHEELEEWASALDEETREELGRCEPGALLTLCTPADLKELPQTAARRGFRRRLVETPGVVATSGDGERVDCSIHIRAITYPVSAATEAAYAKLRTAWVAPADDYPLTSGVEVWAHARALAAGLTYVWDPRPPKEWLEPRRAWGAFVRETIGRSRTLDSELHVAQAVAAGTLDDGGTLERWQAVRDSFVPNSVEVWHDESVLRLCAEWMHTPGIVWTEHAFFAERLARETGASYFGAEGLDARGAFIDDAPSGAIIASVRANREGRNLQAKWSRNLVVSPPDLAGTWQQMIGRTHRPGQRADEVTVDVLLGCAEHANAWRKALAGAAAVRDTTGAESKLLIADVEWPEDSEIARYSGARWGQVMKKAA